MITVVKMPQLGLCLISHLNLHVKPPVFLLGKPAQLLAVLSRISILQ